MRILLTNDDGIYAPGLAALHQALREDHELFVVAPETEQSAVGHAITLSDPIRVRPLGPRTGFKGYAISGTPADCVKLALHELMEDRPDMVIGGINLGANLGVNLLYSGTVSAASEAALNDLPGVAISLGTRVDPDYTFAARFAAHLVKNLDHTPLAPGVPLNVNVPALPPEEIRGVRITRQSQARLKERFIRRIDPRGHIYYWQAGETMDNERELTADYPALLAGYVTITPLGHDLTNHQAISSLDNFNFSLP